MTTRCLDLLPPPCCCPPLLPPPHPLTARCPATEAGPTVTPATRTAGSALIGREEQVRSAAQSLNSHRNRCCFDTEGPFLTLPHSSSSLVISFPPHFSTQAEAELNCRHSSSTSPLRSAISEGVMKRRRKRRPLTFLTDCLQRAAFSAV